MATDISEHVIVPTHEILDENETKNVLMKYKVDRSKLPKIKQTDPALPKDSKIGDVVRITRESPTAGVSIYYRVVVE